jgi:hypothetical protein
MKFWLTAGAVIAVLIATTIVHGRWTGRWQPRVDDAAVAAALDRVPMTIGDWDGQPADAEDQSVYRDEMRLGLLRRYTHRQTGRVVLLLLRGGAPGPISRHHTPASCYHAVGFGDAGPTVKRPVGPDEFWVSNFDKPTPTGRQRVRVYWAYSGDRTWTAPDHPRLALAGHPVCFKMYVVRGTAADAEPLDGDPCESFLAAARPAVNEALFGP